MNILASRKSRGKQFTLVSVTERIDPSLIVSRFNLLVDREMLWGWTYDYQAMAAAYEFYVSRWDGVADPYDGGNIPHIETSSIIHDCEVALLSREGDAGKQYHLAINGVRVLCQGRGWQTSNSFGTVHQDAYESLINSWDGTMSPQSFLDSLRPRALMEVEAE